MNGRHCSGAVLAGGANTRFGGAPKGLAEVGGRRIVDRALDAVRTAADECFLITNDLAVGRAVDDAVVFGDLRSERGSLVGLHSALWYCREAVLVVAWDMPFVSTALLCRLRDQGESARAPALAIGTRGLEPFCAYYPRQTLAIVEWQLERGDLRLSSFLAALPSSAVLSPNDVATLGAPELLFMNVNSAADLAAARAVNPGDDALSSVATLGIPS
jgi:molybdopterin-guanine dinucleotide biosynthesis protein A